MVDINECINYGQENQNNASINDFRNERERKSEANISGGALTDIWHIAYRESFFFAKIEKTKERKERKEWK